MRRVVDGLLIVTILAGVALGAYYIGHRVDTESNNLARQDSGLNQTTAGAATHHTSHRTPIIVVIGIGGVVGGVVRLLIHTPSAISLLARLWMVQLMAAFISPRCTLCGHSLHV